MAMRQTKETMVKYRLYKCAKALRGPERKHNQEIVCAAEYYLKHGFRITFTHGIRMYRTNKGTIECVGCSCPDGVMCSSPGKHPLKAWRPGNDGKYGLTTPDWIQKEFVNAFFYSIPVNIALATGYGFIVVNVDSPETLKKLFEAHPMFERIYHGHPEAVVKTGRGYHFYIEYDDPATPAATEVMPEVTIIGRGGYVIAPPSRHVSGAVYKPLQGEYPKPYTPSPEELEYLDGLLNHQVQTPKKEPRIEMVKEKAPTPYEIAAVALDQILDSLSEAEQNLAKLSKELTKISGKLDTLRQTLIQTGQTLAYLRGLAIELKENQINCQKPREPNN